MIPCFKRFFKTYKDSARFIPLVHVTLYGANGIKYCVLGTGWVLCLFKTRIAKKIGYHICR